MIVSIIVAAAENNIIGKDNQLVWHLPSDLKRFEEITTGHHVIMGRKTFESVGSPLPDRTNIILTSDKNYKQDGCLVVHSLKDALEACKEEDEIFILGGSTIYKQTINIADRMYITRIHHNFDGDTYFVDFDEGEWKLFFEETHQPDEKNKFAYSFRNYERQNSQ